MACMAVLVLQYVVQPDVYLQLQVIGSTCPDRSPPNPTSFQSFRHTTVVYEETSPRQKERERKKKKNSFPWSSGNQSKESSIEIQSSPEKEDTDTWPPPIGEALPRCRGVRSPNKPVYLGTTQYILNSIELRSTRLAFNPTL